MQTQVGIGGRGDVQVADSYDVFNGDADGICALHQFRMAFPQEAQLITGVKRDIQLLQQLPSSARQIAVFDISFDSNRTDIERLLTAGASIRYFDHHTADHAFAHPALQLYWDDAATVCSSLLVDRYLGGRFHSWAISAAFGDNLEQHAFALAQQAGMDATSVGKLRQLGQLLNYNAYGETVADLSLAPAVLYRDLHGYAEPLDFVGSSAFFGMLQGAYQEDCAHLEKLQAHYETISGAIFLLPNQSWARRISGLLANKLSREHPHQSFAVLIEKDDGAYLVSVRSAQPEAKAASQFCGAFTGGGGRRAAAGINHLPAAALAKFTNAFFTFF